MKAIKVKASPAQLSRLRNGHRVRLSKGDDISGCGLYVDPAKFDTMTRCFAKNKGITLQLSPEEIMKNKEAVLADDPEIGGSGIFAGGKLAIQHRAFRNILPVMKKVGDKLGKPFEKTFQVNPFTLGYDLGHDVIAPELKRLPGIKEHYQGKGISQRVSKPFKRLAKEAKAKANVAIEPVVGGGGKLKGVAMKHLKKVAKNALKNIVLPTAKKALKRAISRQVPLAPVEAVAEVVEVPMTEARIVEKIDGEGLYSGARGRGLLGPPSRMPQSYSTSIGGTLLHNKERNVNLQSNPYGENFHMNTQLPPQYQRVKFV